MRVLASVSMLSLLAVACGSAPLDPDSSSRAQGVGDRDREDEADHVKGSAASEEVPFVDEEDEEPVPPPPAPPPPPHPQPSATAMGKDACLQFGSVDQPVQSFNSGAWQYQVKNCQSSACWDFFSLNVKCSLSFQHDNQKQAAQIDPELCRFAARVFTSPRFIDATQACPAIVEPINESFEVDAATVVHRKFSFCNTPAMEEARSCLRWVVATAFAK